MEKEVSSTSVSVLASTTDSNLQAATGTTGTSRLVSSNHSQIARNPNISTSPGVAEPSSGKTKGTRSTFTVMPVALTVSGLPSNSTSVVKDGALTVQAATTVGPSVVFTGKPTNVVLVVSTTVLVSC
ncbi:hypothetical protein K501DRAFT_280776 [Backusella circina FSU 941]|nr:hypothetical protein K501DRAFT_280776 [Backusella circina FSU 941]